MFYLTFCIVCIIVTNTKYCMIFTKGENMVISINDASEIPIYQQIRNQIVLGISDGRLAPGEQLPTVRALAEEIGINSMTVSKAYTLLKQEGYIAEAVPACGRNLKRIKNCRKNPRNCCARSFPKRK